VGGGSFAYSLVSGPGSQHPGLKLVREGGGGRRGSAHPLALSVNILSTLNNSLIYI